MNAPYFAIVGGLSVPMVTRMKGRQSFNLLFHYIQVENQVTGFYTTDADGRCRRLPMDFVLDAPRTVYTIDVTEGSNAAAAGMLMVHLAEIKRDSPKLKDFQNRTPISFRMSDSNPEGKEDFLDVGVLFEGDPAVFQIPVLAFWLRSLHKV